MTMFHDVMRLLRPAGLYGIRGSSSVSRSCAFTRHAWLIVVRQSTNSTVTPVLTILPSSVASQLVRRTQPWLWVLPIFDGSGVP